MVALIVLLVVAAMLVIAIGLVAVGRETFLLAHRARPAVFDLEEAVDFISEGLPDDVAGRLTPDDVRWVLRTDSDQLEQATADAEDVELGPEVLDEDAALARVLQASDAAHRNLDDADIAAVLAGRTAYLEMIGAIGPEVQAPEPARGEPAGRPQGARPGHSG